MKRFMTIVAIFAALFLCFSQVQVLAADIDLAKKSTLETILKRGELRVGFESGYMPFEMTDKKGNFVGFDIDMAKEMAKAMGVCPGKHGLGWDHSCSEHQQV
jgi:polar amino acid transport system substrate-binding protein